MNELLASTILGIVQGITEFLPVSSSGHIAITDYALGIRNIDLSYIAVIHLGTMLAVIVYFWRDIIDLFKEMKRPQAPIWKIAIATIPAVIAGLFLESLIETAVQGVTIVAGALVLTGLILIASDRMIRMENLGKRKKKRRRVGGGKDWKSISYGDAFTIGVAQIAALIPGISRSGVTISMGLLRGLSRESAVRFSFLMSTPIVAGAGVLSLILVFSKGAEGATSPLSLLIGFLAAFVVGFFTIHFFLQHVRKHTLVGYGVYTILLAVTILTWTLVTS